MSVVEVLPLGAMSNSSSDQVGAPEKEARYGWLVVTLRGALVERHRVAHVPTYIGRGPNAHLRLNSKYVSVNHAVVVYEDSQVAIVDLQSKNSTIVNGRAEERKGLSHGDIIVLGDFVLRYESKRGSAEDQTARIRSLLPKGPVPPSLLSEIGRVRSLAAAVAAELPQPEAAPMATAEVASAPAVGVAESDALAEPVIAECDAVSLESGRLDETILAAAIAEAARAGQSPLDVLEEAGRFDTATLTAELSSLFAYRYISARDLMAMEGDFERLPAAEARRRGCVIVRAEGAQTAVIGDPFATELRPWLEARVSGPLGWALAARGDVSAFISRHEQTVRAIDTALEGAHGELSADSDVEELSLASISRDSSPVVKLVRSTLYDALRAGASDVHLEAGGARLEIRYRIDGVLVHDRERAGQ